MLTACTLASLLFAPAAGRVAAQDSAPPARTSAAKPLDADALARQLASRDPLARQRAAEDLAHLAAAEQRRLIEGHRLQEKNARVRVALDWALYRAGRRESLYDLVRALDSGRSDQAQVYLSQLETPEVLYPLLERVNGNTQIKLLQVLSHVGDASTAERIRPLASSPDPKVAEAARAAASEIAARLASPEAQTSNSRRRKAEDDSTEDVTP